MRTIQKPSYWMFWAGYSSFFLGDKLVKNIKLKVFSAADLNVIDAEADRLRIYQYDDTVLTTAEKTIYWFLHGRQWIPWTLIAW